MAEDMIPIYTVIRERGRGMAGEERGGGEEGRREGGRKGETKERRGRRRVKNVERKWETAKKWREDGGKER